MSEEKNGELVPQEQAQTVKPVLQIVYEEADQRVEIMRGLFEKSLRITKKHDWMLQGKGERAKPYLKSDAACQLADFFKFEYLDLQFLPMERIKHKEGPDELLFSVVGKCKIPGLGIQPVMGSSSTRDDLYSKRTKDGKSYYLELHNISIPKVKNKALTNFLGNGPRHRLNLINIPIAEFERMTGFEAATLTDSIEYKGGSGKKKVLSVENEKKLEEIKKMAIYLTQGVAELEGELLLSVTANPAKGFNGTSDYNRLSDAQVSWIHREYEKRNKKQMETEANPPGAKS